jgi:tape measure domain-containing protein
MAVIGELAVNVVARTSGLSSGMNRARKEMGLMSSAALGVRRSLLALGAAFTAFRASTGFIEAAMGAEKAKATFEVLTGSMSEGLEIYKELFDLAAGTPLQLGNLQRDARTLMLFNVSAKEVTKTLKMMGDITGGDPEAMRFMVRAYGQIRSLGRLQAQDLMQLTNAGWNPLNQIVKRTGESMEQVRERMKDGGVSFEEVKQAMIDATSEGGRFNGLMDKMGKTLEGRINALRGEWQALSIQIGDELLPLVKEFLEITTSLVKWARELDPWWKKVLVTIGAIGTVLGTAVVAMWALHKATLAYKAVQAQVAIITAMIAGFSGNWKALALGIVGAGVAATGLYAIHRAYNKESEDGLDTQQSITSELERQKELMDDMAAGRGGADVGGTGANGGVQDVNVTNTELPTLAEQSAAHLKHLQEVREEIKNLKGSYAAQQQLKIARIL